MSLSDKAGEFERFVDSAEGREWLACRGWVRVSDIFDKALIVPVAAEDILEDALVLVIERGPRDVEAEGENLNERGIMGRVALVREENAAGA